MGRHATPPIEAQRLVQHVIAGPPKTGRERYQNACAACHGADGTGAPRTQVGFDTPLPDLTDCNFATREPDADWLAVAHQGGPVRGFAQEMPAFGDALTQEEILKILRGQFPIFGRANLNRRIRTVRLELDMDDDE